MIFERFLTTQQSGARKDEPNSRTFDCPFALATEHRGCDGHTGGRTERYRFQELEWFGPVDFVFPNRLRCGLRRIAEDQKITNGSVTFDRFATNTVIGFDSIRLFSHVVVDSETGDLHWRFHLSGRGTCPAGCSLGGQDEESYAPGTTAAAPSPSIGLGHRRYCLPTAIRQQRQPGSLLQRFRSSRASTRK